MGRTDTQKRQTRQNRTRQKYKTDKTYRQIGPDIWIRQTDRQERETDQTDRGKERSDRKACQTHQIRPDRQTDKTHT